MNLLCLPLSRRLPTGASPRGRGRVPVLMVTLALLAGCSNVAKMPRWPSGSNDDSPPSTGQPAQPLPRVEPIDKGGANLPYVVRGRRYVPRTDDSAQPEEGVASWYGPGFHGRLTASGEVYNMNAMTAAHKTMPLPSYALVRNLRNQREVVVRVNDRGPFVKGRVIDLSYAAARQLGIHGVAKVEIRRITNEEIQAGLWRAPAVVTREPGAPPAADDAGTTGGPARDAAATAAVAGATDGTPGTRLTDAAVTGDGVLVASADETGATTQPVTPPALPIVASLPPAAPRAEGALPNSGADPAPTMPPRDETGAGGAAAPDAPAPADADGAGMQDSGADAATAAASPDVDPRAARAHTQRAAGWWLQLGAWRRKQGAFEFQQQVEAHLQWLTPLLTVFDDDRLYRLQAGPWASRAEAERAAHRVGHELKVKPMLVRRKR